MITGELRRLAQDNDQVAHSDLVLNSVNRSGKSVNVREPQWHHHLTSILSDLNLSALSARSHFLLRFLKLGPLLYL